VHVARAMAGRSGAGVSFRLKIRADETWPAVPPTGGPRIEVVVVAVNGEVLTEPIRLVDWMKSHGTVVPDVEVYTEEEHDATR